MEEDEGRPPVWSKREPSQFLVDNAGLLPKGGRALDVAMGTGRNAVYLASLGFEVTGVEISEEACGLTLEAARAAGVPIEAVCADLESWGPPAEAFDVVINFNYLHRPLCPLLAAALKPGGVLVFETFTTEQRQFGWGPSRDDFLLLPGELRRLFPGLETLVYREGVEEGERGKKAAAGLVARRPR
ncbi:MAG TPA: class I SAM-dependent methyltransferase [Dehalococcoidia bacterium]|nr:class I SAM-dependent methyltransferase [Dehalococcoidia bacterium]